MKAADTWKHIHSERRQMAETWAAMSSGQWAVQSWCQGWSVQDTAGHIVAAAEQTPPNFYKELASAGFRFNVSPTGEPGAWPPSARMSWSAGCAPGPRPRTTRLLPSWPCWARSSCTARTSAGPSA